MIVSITILCIHKEDEIHKHRSRQYAQYLKAFVEDKLEDACNAEICSVNRDDRSCENSVTLYQRKAGSTKQGPMPKRGRTIVDIA
ncbi:hypothetical protein KIN20_020362 [Parelaphostrongylus tenuis]|uniref:Uncharacterized protein n=1 Tax=Parelaphostrongylus tenuis TaxID=148309 RepID=A0AAD5N9R2_PARTN|nr:hypothetical protein KIN20_020362 [Parelaphostrongylus tenuis]